MKKWIHAAQKIEGAEENHTSGCSFDFDLGDSYDSTRIENKIIDVFADLGLDALGVDFRAVEYPHDKVYSQAGVDFTWTDEYDADAIEDALYNMIEDEGGNFFGIDFYSVEN